MVYIVMGVAGCGKTTVAKLLARKLGLPFHDADDDQPRENVASMMQGVPLTDEQRKPWLEGLAAAVAKWNEGAGAVLACSALKEDHRRTLSRNGSGEVLFIYLYGSPELIRNRLESRHGHYFPPMLLKSQLEILEVPSDAVAVEITGTPQEIVLKILDELGKEKGRLQGPPL